MPEHTCDVVVVHCIDFRLQQYLNDWFAKRFVSKGYDRVAVAGGIKNIDFVLSQIEVSYRLHKVKKAVLINHEDCGAYGADGTYERHKADLAEAQRKVLKSFPSLQVEKYYLHLDGNFELIA